MTRPIFHIHMAVYNVVRDGPLRSQRRIQDRVCVCGCVWVCVCGGGVHTPPTHYNLCKLYVHNNYHNNYHIIETIYMFDVITAGSIQVVTCLQLFRLLS